MNKHEDGDGLTQVEQILAAALWDGWADEKGAPGIRIFDDPRTVARRLRQALEEICELERSETLEELARLWQWSEWGNLPRRRDPLQERLAIAQHVTQWIRSRANGKL